MYLADAIYGGVDLLGGFNKKHTDCELGGWDLGFKAENEIENQESKTRCIVIQWYLQFFCVLVLVKSSGATRPEWQRNQKAEME